MAMSVGGDATEKPLSDINTTPLVDVMLVLLIIFLIAVPAVLAYNWLQRRNKSIAEDLSAFSNDVLGFLASNGKVRPTIGSPAKAPVKPVGATATAGQAGGVQTRA